MAATAISDLVLGLTAAGAIAQFQPVQATGAPAVAGGNALGFATVAAASGARVPVAAGGTAIAIAGAAIAVGAAVEVGRGGSEGGGAADREVRRPRFSRGIPPVGRPAI